MGGARGRDRSADAAPPSAGEPIASTIRIRLRTSITRSSAALGRGGRAYTACGVQGPEKEDQDGHDDV